MTRCPLTGFKYFGAPSSPAEGVGPASPVSGGHLAASVPTFGVLGSESGLWKVRQANRSGPAKRPSRTPE